MSISNVAVQSALITLSDKEDHEFLADCRNLGARDVFDLFHIKYKQGVAVDYIRDRHPESLNEMIHAYFRNIDPHTEIGRVLSDASAEFIPQQTLWESIKLYFQRYSLINSEGVDNIRVPIFCAHATSVPNSKFDVTFSTASSKEAEFKIGVPGFSGGFGMEKTVSFTSRIPRQTQTLQFQARLRALLNTWSSTDKSVQLFSPVELIDTTDCYEDDPAFIHYDTKRKNKLLKGPINCKTNGGDREFKITKRARDEFEFRCEVLGLSCLMNVKSSTTQELKVTHDVFFGYTYAWYGLDKNCHDVFVTAAPTSA